MITLESAKIAFDTWRASKANINTPAPAELWGMVEQLLPTYRRAEICKVLRISGHQIKSYCTATLPAKAQVLLPPKANGDFVEALPAQPIEKPHIETVANTGMSELTVKGRFKSLHLCLPTIALRELLPVLGELL